MEVAEACSGEADGAGESGLEAWGLESAARRGSGTARVKDFSVMNQLHVDFKHKGFRCDQKSHSQRFQSVQIIVHEFFQKCERQCKLLHR